MAFTITQHDYETTLSNQVWFWHCGGENDPEFPSELMESTNNPSIWRSYLMKYLGEWDSQFEKEFGTYPTEENIAELAGFIADLGF